MASTFPTSLDSILDPLPTDPVTNHAELHQLINDAVEKLQAKVGINSSGVTTTLDYLLKNASSTDPGHKHTASSVGLGNVTNNKQIKAITTTTIGYIPTWNSTTGDLLGTGLQYGNTGANKILQVKSDGMIDSTLYVVGITGEIKIWSGTSAPSGWAICDGSAVSRAIYATLFGIVGTTYGVGDGSTTFNLPNLKGKTVVGYNVSETEFNTIGKTGGEKTHTLTEAQMPAHTHTIGLYSSGGGGSANPAQGQVYQTSTGTTSSTGGGTAHNNLQPYIALNYIIKL